MSGRRNSNPVPLPPLSGSEYRRRPLSDRIPGSGWIKLAATVVSMLAALMAFGFFVLQALFTPRETFDKHKDEPAHSVSVVQQQQIERRMVTVEKKVDAIYRVSIGIAERLNVQQLDGMKLQEASNGRE